MRSAFERAAVFEISGDPASGPQRGNACGYWPQLQRERMHDCEAMKRIPEPNTQRMLE